MQENRAPPMPSLFPAAATISGVAENVSAQSLAPGASSKSREEIVIQNKKTEERTPTNRRAAEDKNPDNGPTFRQVKTGPVCVPTPPTGPYFEQHSAELEITLA
jgi:hypothetical protein